MLPSKLVYTSLLTLLAFRGTAQELFVYNEPASNMPARSAGIRVTNWIMGETGTNNINYHLLPEIMVGINNKLMLHAEAFISNRTQSLKAEGGGLYAKYRIYTHDNMYHHFRMAVFARGSMNNSDIHQEEIQTNAHNTGYQLGFIGTQLLHKTALSLTAYYERDYNNYGGNELPATLADRAMNFNLSSGHLFYPKHYKGYKQTNINVMVEAMSQVLPQNGKRFIDIAPSVQFIFNSQTRIDIGYRKELYSTMQRTAPNGLLLRVEHLLFNVI